MSKDLEARLSEVWGDRHHHLQKIIEDSSEPDIRIRARTILERDQEILNLLGRS